MVWGLFPADPLSGEEKYYIFSKGIYKVGRKGCDVIINKDKGVSRIHAEIVIDNMTFLDYQKKKSTNISSQVRLKDFSKYGTFINKNLGSAEKVHEFPNKETTLKDGDLISFGTGTATYRFCFVPMVFFVCCLKPLLFNQFVSDKILSIGACMTHKWSPECTHVLVDDLMPVMEDAVDAIVAKKPFVCYNWVEFIAEKNIQTEIPSCISYAPAMMWEGLSINIADPKTRETCLRGYTFLLDPIQKYRLKDRLQLLLEVSGAKVVSVEGFCPNSQGLDDEGNATIVHVIPAGFADGSVYIRKFNSVARVNETDLIRTALSGNLDSSTIASPPVLVATSCSTDETVVADSDAELETASSFRESIVAKTTESFELEAKGEMPIQIIDSVDHDYREEIPVKMIECAEHENKAGIAVHGKESVEHEGRREILADHADGISKSGDTAYLREKNDCITVRRDKVDESESKNSDIIYSQDLVVRDVNCSTAVLSSTKTAVLNFKRFKKMMTESGNSFNNLIPFSKYPYNDSDNGNEEVKEFMKEEKKRKQMEAVAEDLFNNEKGRKRGTTGSLHGLFCS